MEENTSYVFQTYSGEKFTMDHVTESKFCSTSALGYIIAPNGLMVEVPFGSNHPKVFSEYLSKYIGTDEKVDLKAYPASSILAEYGHITYMGAVQNNSTMVLHGKVAESSFLLSGSGLVSLPNDLEKITLEQATSLLDLIKSNKTISGTSRVDLKFGIISKDISYTEDQMIQLLNAIIITKSEQKKL